MNIRLEIGIAKRTREIELFSRFNDKIGMFYAGVIPDLRTEEDQGSLLLLVPDLEYDLIANPQVAMAFWTEEIVHVLNFFQT